ncbi:MAG: ATP-binding cassette domain-containing protein [Dehalococcoidia bacterium]
MNSEIEKTTEGSNSVTISVDNVSKNFGPLKAVQNLTFNITRGEIVGFLGRNGAGKTTTIRLLTSYYTADEGKILIEGVDNTQDDLKTRNSIGYLPENNPLYEDLLVSEYLDFIADLRKMKGSDRKGNIDRTIEEAGLQQVFHRPIHELSKGYHQRVGLAGAILHRPSILILDEPSEGLDPNQKLAMRDLIKSLGKDRTVLLTTHIMQEVENTCERVIIIGGGHLILDSKLEDVSQHAPSELKNIYVEIEGSEIEKGLSSIPSIESLIRLDPKENRKRYIVELSGEIDPRLEIFKLSHENKWNLWDLHQDDVNLEDVFNHLTKEDERKRGS